MRLGFRDCTDYFALNGLVLLLLLLTLSIVPEARAEGAHKIQLIELKHRSAAEVQAAIKPHLSEGTVVSQQNQKLVLSGEASSLEQLEILIDALDQPVPSWRVFFAQGQVNMQASQEKSVRHYSTARSDIFELLVREGSEARLERGFWIPVQTGVGQYRETGFEWLSSGVWVTVNPVGEQLVLNLSTQQAKPKTRDSTQFSSFTGRQFEGEVALQLGQWVTLGSEAQLAAQTSNAARRYVGGSSSEFYSICIEESDKATCPR